MGFIIFITNNITNNIYIIKCNLKNEKIDLKLRYNIGNIIKQ